MGFVLLVASFRIEKILLVYCRISNNLYKIEFYLYKLIEHYAVTSLKVHRSIHILRGGDATPYHL